MKKKIIAIVLVCVLVFGVAVAGTLAWLADKTDTVKNTFVVGDIEIELAETKGTGSNTEKTFALLPGVEIEKDPKVTVLANSEKCYLFVKVQSVNNSVNSKTILTYAAAEGWTAVEGQSGVYYRVVDKSAVAQPFDVLLGNKVTVNSALSASDCETLEETEPVIDITAYAVQFDGIKDGDDADNTAVLEAWAAATEAANY